MKKKYYNCGQIILSKFAEHFSLPETLIDEFKQYGFGGAPTKECGALYAAKYLLKDNLVACEQFEKDFFKFANSAKCKVIRVENKVSCRDCIRETIRLMRKQINDREN